jgi:hypothetical protein
VVLRWAAGGSIVRAGTAHGTAQGAHARCARPYRRTAHTEHPPIGGARRGARSAGPTPGLRRTGGHPWVGRWSASSGELQHRCGNGTTPAYAPARGVTLSNENGLSRSQAYRHPHPPPYGPERAVQGPGRRSSRRLPPRAGPLRMPVAYSQKPRPTGPPRGSGALRAIDSYGAAAILADLRPAPPAAASQPALVATPSGAEGMPRCWPTSASAARTRPGPTSRGPIDPVGGRAQPATMLP